MVVRSLALAACVACSGPAARPDAGPLDDGAPADAEIDPLSVLEPTEPAGLNVGSTAQEEDPWIVIAGDGSLYTAFYSNRAGLHPGGRERKELFVVSSRDGATWTEPVAMTDNDEWSFYPSLAQDGDGVFHLAWMRWHLLPAGCVPPDCTGVDKRIMVNRSADGASWSEGDAEEISAGPADEVPCLVATSDGRLLVYYTSGFRAGDTDRQIFVIVNDGEAWAAPAVVDVSSTGDHDTFPHVVERAPGQFLMTWTRYDLAAGDNLFHPSTTTMYSTSADGLSWSTPVALNPAEAQPTIDVFPFLYPDHDRSRWFAAWVTEAGTVDLPVDGTYPDDLASLPIPGYTPRFAPTPTPGVFWAVWAEGSNPDQKIRYRYFSRP